MKVMLAIGIIPFLTGCVVTKQTYGPDGRSAFSMNCSGLALSWANCYEKAGELCGASGYNVLAVNGETGAVIVANPQSAFGSTVINRTMLVSCKARETPAVTDAKPVPPASATVPATTQKCAVRVISSGGKPVPEDEQC